MRKLAIAITGVAALVLAAILAWNAEATTLTSAAAFHSETNRSLVEKAGCWLPGLPGECEIGQQKVCDRFHKRGCRCGALPWVVSVAGKQSHALGIDKKGAPADRSRRPWVLHRSTVSCRQDSLAAAGCPLKVMNSWRLARRLVQLPALP